MAHTKTWKVDVFLYESGDTTTAEAVLETGEAAAVHARGSARRNPADRPVPEIGDELACARALSALAHQLLDIVAEDISAAQSASSARQG